MNGCQPTPVMATENLSADRSLDLAAEVLKWNSNECQRLQP